MHLPAALAALVAFALASDGLAAADGPGYRIHYHGDFADRYPREDAAYDLAGSPLEPPVETWDVHRSRRAVVVRTNGGLVPYDRSRANIRIDGDGIPPRTLVAQGFRTIGVTWVGSRIVHVQAGLGRIAGVEGLYDVILGRWLHQTSISFELLHADDASAVPRPHPAPGPADRAGR